MTGPSCESRSFTSGPRRRAAGSAGSAAPPVSADCAASVASAGARSAESSPQPAGTAAHAATAIRWRIRVMRASLLGTKLTWAPFRYTVVGNGFAGEGVRRCFDVRCGGTDRGHGGAGRRPVPEERLHVAAGLLGLAHLPGLQYQHRGRDRELSGL